MTSSGHSLQHAAVFAIVAGVVGLAGCASGAPIAAPTSTSPSPAASVRAVDVAAGATDQDIAVSVPAGTAGVGVTFREITIAPGAGTGKHCHDGQLIAVVRQGALTHYAPDHPDGVRVFEEGEAIVEGSGYVHEGRNESDVDVVLWVTYLIPEGDPLAETDLTRCDA